MATASPTLAESAAPPPRLALSSVAALPVEHHALLTIGVMLATIIQILDTTIANVALPHMQTTLGASIDTISWVLTSYMVAAAIATPITGWLSDRMGSRNLFLASVAVFILSSALCGAAQSLEQMVVFRTLQGVAAAFMGPVGQTVLLDINAPDRQAKAMGLWGLGIMIGPIAGPVLGGWLTENFNWRWVFYVNLPIGVVCFALLWWLLPSRPVLKRRFDIFGFTLLSIGLAGLQLMFDRGQGKDWFSSNEIWIELLVGGIALWMFAVRMATAKHPMFDRALWKNRNLTTSMAFMGVMGLVMMTTMSLLPPMLQSLYNHSVLETGTLLMPRGIGVIVTMLITTQLQQRGVDPRLIIAVGLTITAYAMWTMTSWSLDMDSRPVLVSGFIQGLGMGTMFTPVTVLAFGTLDPKYRTDGSSMMNVLRSLGGSVGISVATSQLARNAQISHADLAPHINQQSLPIDPNMLQAMGGSGDTVMAMLNGEVTRQAMMIAYLDDFKMMAIVTILSIPLVFVLRKPKGPMVSDPGAAGH